MIAVPSFHGELCCAIVLLVSVRFLWELRLQSSMTGLYIQVQEHARSERRTYRGRTPREKRFGGMIREDDDGVRHSN